MPSVIHSLGEFEHIYDRANLKLKTQASTAISSSQLFEFPFSNCFRDLEALVLSSTWVNGGHRFQLLIDISFDGILLLDRDMARVTEDLGTLLCNAEIWARLGLEASLSFPEEISTTPNFSRRMSILLTRQSSSQSVAQPPDGILCACLESVDLKLKFSPCRRQRTPLSNTRPVTAWNSSIIVTDPRIKRLDHIPSSATLFPGKAPMNAHNQTAKYASGLECPAYEDDRSPASNTTSSAPHSPLSSQDNTSSVSSLSLTGIYLQSCRSGVSAYSPAATEVSFEQLIKLVDALLQSLVRGDIPTRKNIKGGSQPKDKAVILSSDEGLPKLSMISPALFSLGYHEAISHHSDFLSTIAYTMCNVSRRKVNFDVRYKVNQLLNLCDYQYLSPKAAEASGNKLNDSRLGAAIQARLWFLMQRKLSDPIANQKLKFLRDPKSKSSSYSALPDILDENISPSHDMEFPFCSEEKDLLNESQDYLMDDMCCRTDTLFDDESLIELEDMDDNLLMTHETNVDSQVTDDEAAWESLDEQANLSFLHDKDLEDILEQAEVHDDSHPLVNAEFQDMLEESKNSMNELEYAEGCSGGPWYPDNSLED